MKLHELLKEAGPEGELTSYAPYDQSEQSPGNLDYATGDEAERAFYDIAEDPERYFARVQGGRVSPEQAQMIKQVLSTADDKTFELIGQSPMVQRAIEDNYAAGIDQSYIPLEVVMQVIQKLQARG